MKKVLALVGGGLLFVGIIAAVLWRERMQVTYRQDRAQLEWQAAKLAESATAKGPIPASWDLGLFVSNSALEKITTSLQGTAFLLKDDDLRVKINSVSLTAIPTFIEIRLDLTATSAKRNATLRLNAVGELAYTGLNRIDDRSELLHFRIIPIEIHPEIAWLGFDIRGGRLASDLLTSGLLPRLLESAPIELPVQSGFSTAVGGKTASTIDINKSLGSTLTYDQTMAEFDLSWTAQVIFSLILRQGIWLLASTEAAGGQTTPQDPGGRTPDVLNSEASAVRAIIEKIQTPAADMAIWLSSKPLLNTINKFAQLPDDKRTISIQSTKVAGRIAENKWRDDVLGEGGTFAEFVDDRAVSGQIVLAQIGAHWSPEAGMGLSLDANAHAEAKVHVHVDPLIGGGIGTSIGLVGGASTHLSASLTLVTASIDSEKALVLRPTYQCSSLTLDLETDGKAKTDFGWTKVPSIGIVRHQPIDLSGLKPQLLLDDLPMVVDSRDRDGSFKEIHIAERTAIVEPPWRYFSVAVSSSDARTTESGWIMTAGLMISASTQPLDQPAIARKRDQLRTDTKNFWNSPQCEGDTTTEVKLGPFLIGPNNELVKFFVGIGKFTKEMAERIGHEVSTDKLKQWVSDPVGSFQRSTPGQILANPGRAITQPVQDYCAHNWCP